MGLDMYLSAERYYWFNEEPPKAENGLPVKSLRVEAGYWRKVNHIHKWFVDNVQDGSDECEEFFVSREQLTALRDVCLEVLKDHAKAKELLPTQSGFFFGGTEYDDYYFEALERTVAVCNKCLDLELYPESGWDFYYRSSW